ncbi:hypothetical protein [Akkermansia muciniphila]|uniref:hypothetical protein n=1 Tax=Akkermansia muciniphila TaxID=239935 RepID=UPI001C9D8D4C|nr:hypothetical protein [Akkermansia muciniphila]
MTEKPIQLGLAGLGTVGSGVYETLCRNHALLEARSKIPFRLKRIAVRNLEKPRETVVPRELLTDDWQDLVNDPEIDIIIELIGGTRQAYDLVTLALRAGKPVVTGTRLFWPSTERRFSSFPRKWAPPFISKRPPAAASPLSRACRIP